MTLEQALTRLFGEEGGYVDDPNDPGGATRWGVTERIARAAGYTGDMRDYPQSDAAAIYREGFWGKVRANELPEELRFSVFDAAVNSGPEEAARWLQRALGVTADGIIGPATIAAAAAAQGLVARYNGIRLAFMADLPGWEHDGKGWARRVAAILQSP